MFLKPQNRKIWFKGKFVVAEEAKVPILSPTAQFGLNVFEGIRGYWNAECENIFIFRLEEHLERLEGSCRLAGLQCPYTRDEVIQFVLSTIRENSYREDISLRITIFVEDEGSWSSSAPIGMFIAPVAKARSDVNKLVGKRACISTWRRISDLTMPPRVKLGANYLNGRYAYLEAKRNGFDLPILLNHTGRVSEGAGSCLFAIKKGVLITPPVTASILESITRDTVIELGKAIGCEIEERPVERTELYLADEVFLCGSAAELLPVVEIDNINVADGSAGPLTKKLLKAYLNAVSNGENARQQWLTSVY